MAKDRILIVGVGGLGVPALWALARAGARRLTLVDPDPVELSNLARQVIYRDRDIGTPKVEAAARWLVERFPDVKVERHAVALDESNAARLVGAHDFVIDATDSPVAKFLINDTCIVDADAVRLRRRRRDDRAGDDGDSRRDRVHPMRVRDAARRRRNPELPRGGDRRSGRGRDWRDAGDARRCAPRARRRSCSQEKFSHTTRPARAGCVLRG